jgi:hypothetical protein
MIRNRIWLLALLFPQTDLQAAEKEALEIVVEHASIEVHSMESYRTYQHIEGRNASAAESSLGFSIAESASLETILFSVNINGKNKKLNANDYISVSTINWSAFFTGSQNYRLRIPANCSFSIDYTTSNPETIFLSKIYKNGFFDASDFSCEIHLPEGLVLTTRDNREFSGEVVFDSTDFQPEQESVFYLIHPAGTQPEAYFSEWFGSRINPITKMDPALLPAELEQLKQKGDRNALAAGCFRYVQDKIRYVDIENGIHAIVPRPCNQTMINKYGDCKDMATLLHALLLHYGFESYLSVSRTFIKKDTFDFPSIAMANHMIVSLRLNENWIFLDATEEECLFGDPSRQILGTEVFLIGYPTGHFVPVPSKPRYEPTLRLEYYFARTAENRIELTTTLISKGKLNGYFHSLSNDLILTNDKAAEYLRNIFPFQPEITGMEISDSASVIRFRMLIRPDYCTEIGSKTYLDASFLPDIRLLSLVFSGMEEPTFSARYEVQLSGIQLPKASAVGEKVRTSITPQNNYQVMFSIDETNLEKGGQPDTFWKSLITKPFILIL